MASTKSPAGESDYHNFSVDTDDKRCCWSKMCWLLLQLYHYTIGSCCYTPIRWLCTKLCCGLYCCRNILKQYDDYAVLSKITLTGSEKDKQWIRKSCIDKADSKMKERLQRQFQDHIQKWTDAKHRRFPWKVLLHLLLVVFVTVQVSGINYVKYTSNENI